MTVHPFRFNWSRPWQQRLLPVACALALSVGALGLPDAQATDLPPGVLHYLRQKDPNVKLRFDAVVMFSNGEIYVPVIPQDPSLNPDSQQVVAVFPEKAAYPDLIQFDNNFFLMRLIQTASGRLTFPKLAQYPLQLKEGLLPQDLVLPDNLFIPVELKVILGALPYNPGNAVPPASQVLPQGGKPSGQTSPVAPNVPLLPLGDTHGNPSVEAPSVPVAPQALKSLVRLTYVFDLAEQKLIGIDTLSGRKLADVALDCVPSSLKLSEDGKLLFAPCLSSNELVVVDTGSNLVKTRVPVGQRPDAVLYLENAQQVLVSNRFSPFLSLVNRDELVSGQKIDLTGNGGAMAVVPGGASPQVVVADAFKDKIYLVDMNSRAVMKTLKALEDISAVQVFRQTNGALRVWATSRSKGQLVLIDVDTDRIVKTIEVGAKPVAIGTYRDKLFVVSAGAGQVSVVDRPTQAVVATIPLGEDAFPSGIVTVQDEKRAYVVSAAANTLAVINLETNQLENTFSVDYRANMIATVPDKLDPQQRDAVNPAEVLPVEMTKRGKGKSNQVGPSLPSSAKEKPHRGLFGKEAVQPGPMQSGAAKSGAASTVKTSVKSTASRPAKATTDSPAKAKAKLQKQSAIADPGVGPDGTMMGAEGLPSAVVIPEQQGNAGASPLSGDKPGQLRLRFGHGDKKAVNQPAPTNAVGPAIAPVNAFMLGPDTQK